MMEPRRASRCSLSATSKDAVACCPLSTTPEDPVARCPLSPNGEDDNTKQPMSKQQVPGWAWLLPAVGMTLILGAARVPLASGEGPQGQLQYCSFFNNRAPKAQPSLQNCTWFKGNSCCQQQEIQTTFGQVKPMKGASPACQRYVNYLMCYICAPNQNLFYQNERLTVCEDFCDELYGACKAATLKGSVIGDLYENGREFCGSRRFLVATDSCFQFDAMLDTSGSPSAVGSPYLLLPGVLVALYMAATLTDQFIECVSSSDPSTLLSGQSGIP